MVKKERCSWCKNDVLYERYHDEEWGVPLKEANELFELLAMEGMQAGLSWITILRKRKRFRELMFNLEPERLANQNTGFVDTLMQDAGIIRHRGKLQASIQNAQIYQSLGNEREITEYLWSFCEGKTITNAWMSMSDVPAFTVESEQMSKSLKKRGFKFVGPTICYAFMQSAGMVNDHLVSCFRHAQVTGDKVVRNLVE